jgi:hypothetical protein
MGPLVVRDPLEHVHAILEAEQENEQDVRPHSARGWRAAAWRQDAVDQAGGAGGICRRARIERARTAGSYSIARRRRPVRRRESRATPRDERRF